MHLAKNILHLPDNILEDVFLQLDLHDLAISKRVCKYFNSILTASPVLLLHFELQGANLSAPLKVRKSTSAKALLGTLRERQTRFRNLAPSRSYNVDLEPDEGRLYEYLEGVLLRGNGLRATRTPRPLPSGTTLYDFTQSGEWETLDETDVPYSSGGLASVETETDPEVIESTEDDAREEYLKRKWASPFEVKDITMDPGQDLFVAAEMVNVPQDSGASWKLHLHFLTLSTFGPHPLAVPDGRIESCLEMPTRIISLILQVCDDHLFVFASRISDFRIPEAIARGWNWKTGQLLFTETSRTSNATRETGLQTLEDFLLLSSDMFCAATYTSAPDIAGGELLSTLNYYSFEPIEKSTAAEKHAEPTQAMLRRPSHVCRLLLRLTLPAFQLICDIGLRADPPPRAFFPHANPLQLYPQPDTGTIVITFDCADGHPVNAGQSTFYTLLILRETLLSLITPEMLVASRIAEYLPPLLPFSTISPLCRFRSFDEQQGWVCFVYHYRYITGQLHDEEDDDGQRHISVHDFDPRNARREILRRKRVNEENNRGNENAGETTGDKEAISQARADGSESATDDRLPGAWPVDEGASVSPEPRTSAAGLYVDENGYDLLQLDGLDIDGIYLHIEEEFVDANEDQHIKESVRSGSKMPYISVIDPRGRHCHGLMIDDARIVTINESLHPSNCARLEVLDMN